MDDLHPETFERGQVLWAYEMALAHLAVAEQNLRQALDLIRWPDETGAAVNPALDASADRIAAALKHCRLVAALKFHQADYGTPSRSELPEWAAAMDRIENLRAKLLEPAHFTHCEGSA